jgi:hypothetical protein
LKMLAKKNRTSRARAKALRASLMVTMVCQIAPSRNSAGLVVRRVHNWLSFSFQVFRAPSRSSMVRLLSIRDHLLEMDKEISPR